MQTCSITLKNIYIKNIKKIQEIYYFILKKSFLIMTNTITKRDENTNPSPSSTI